MRYIETDEADELLERVLLADTGEPLHSTEPATRIEGTGLARAPLVPMKALVNVTTPLAPPPQLPPPPPCAPANPFAKCPEAFEHVRLFLAAA
jgi:hypothetical protein